MHKVFVGYYDDGVESLDFYFYFNVLDVFVYDEEDGYYLGLLL